MKLLSYKYIETRVDSNGVTYDVYEQIWEGGDITYDLIPQYDEEYV